MNWSVSCLVAGSVALMGCDQIVRQAEAAPSGSKDRPNKFEFRFKGWKYDRFSGKGLVAMKLGGLTLRLGGKATKGELSTRARAIIVASSRSTYMSISFPEAGIDCKGMRGKEHGLDIELESKAPARGTVSGEIGCKEKGAKRRTWVGFSGVFDQKGL